MCVVSDDEGPAPRLSNRISANNWDEEQLTTLGMCVVNLKNMSLGLNHDAPTCIETKNMQNEAGSKEKCETSKTYHERTWI